MRPMGEAPRDRDILVLGPRGWRRVSFVDCEWLRESAPVFNGGRVIPGDPSIADCWRPTRAFWESDIEMHEARGWKPATNSN